MPAMPIIGTIALACALIIAFIAVARWMNHRTESLYKNTRRDGMIAHSICMIRDGGIECPGVALVADDTLMIQTVFGKKRQIPLSTVTVKRETRGSGKYAWWGKQVFFLETPETTNLAIGVKDAELWRKALIPRVDGPITKP